MIRRFAVAAMAVAVLAATPAYAAETVKTNQVTKEKLGQLVQIEGKISSFRPSKGERSPNSFFLKDSAGEIRVVIWPDVFTKIPNNAALATDGTSVKLEGEVAEYREKIELHVPDATRFQVVGGASTGAGTTTATVSATTTTTASR